VSAIVRVHFAAVRALAQLVIARSQARSAGEFPRCAAKLSPRNLRTHGRATAPFAAFARKRKTSSRKNPQRVLRLHIFDYRRGDIDNKDD
jgi:hypothetical protein